MRFLFLSIKLFFETLDALYPTRRNRIATYPGQNIREIWMLLTNSLEI